MASEVIMADRALPPSAALPRRSGLGDLARRVLANNWKVAFYVLLIILCILFAPEEPLKFIYTEF